MKGLDENTKKLLVLGILSGMRANAGLLFTSLLIRQEAGVYFSPSRLVGFFNNKNATLALLASGAGEMVMDKLPGTPNRTSAGGLTGRVISGAASGAAINKAAGKSAVAGAMIAGLASLTSTFIFFWLRKNISRKTHTPDPYIGAAEDVLTVAFGLTLLKSMKSTTKYQEIKF